MNKIHEDSKVTEELITKLNSLHAKERMQIPVQEMPMQDPVERRSNIKEVALGFSEKQAIIEANRCLQCKNAPCVKACPVNIKIPDFIKKITEQKYSEAVDVIKETNVLPAICGRVCPQETQCQSGCVVGKSLKDINKAVGIGRLERFVADYDRKREQEKNNKVNLNEVSTSSKTTKKVAVIGSGPASIVVAADVRKAGHEVTVFEAFHRLGGVLLYGIPEFRLPKEIVEYEIENLRKLGVKFQTNFVFGKTRTLKALMEKDGFDAVFIGIGAGLPNFLNIPGENYVGVFSANEYLTRANLMKGYNQEQAHTPMYNAKKIAILGGGNVAMDAARTAVRLGAEEVYLIYRRSMDEMPARAEEVEHAIEEGVIFKTLCNAKQIIGNDDQCVTGIECLKYELGEEDNSGRRRPVAIKNSEFTLDIDSVIIAIGNSSNPLIKQTTPELELNERGNILVKENQETSVKNVFAGGDIVRGAATVILAMGEGRKAAAAINKALK
ncbi:NADPH-dependent glutamate synthase [Lentisphaerota bacterium WC36G]|nr:NADPH-dependent glutamate synthase [Lentisphaerae bacterium WC36]